MILRFQSKTSLISSQGKRRGWRHVACTPSFILGTVVLPLIASLMVPTRASAADGVKGTVIVRTKVVGPYRLVLQVGPPEKMLMSGQPGPGEVMAPGAMAAATCSMAMSGMTMGKSCNHHLELHVYEVRAGRVVTHASVAIVLHNVRSHQTIHVPIMTMMDPKKGMRDYHYGNNIYAPRGSYTVTVRVNRVAAVFSIQL